ncbi:L-aspartate oxidase [Desulfolucanica intricata]|uniref:L-aspartate oxidase n=1 Tax=Desulfolucanica intricata TaxID=1285191 RepID=UPI00082F32AB|nr:L-aspartate oxidase [Desulfolucanica intricata]
MHKIITDYLVIGSGIAGLSCALKASRHGKVALLTKGDLLTGNTALAQGGVAAALAPDDSPKFHFQDTLEAGAGTCIPEAVEILVNEGASRVLELKELGVPFDYNKDGSFDLAREGAHSHARIVSALGDSTGKAIAKTLIKKVKKEERITIYEQTAAIRLLTHKNECIGSIAIKKNNNILIFIAKATVLATGGCGQVYQHTTNNKFCTGDGFALAYQAGARLKDMEFIQFHPTALAFEENPRLLISEAVRGEGAVLVNQKGKRFMLYHPQGELAPRDIVARGIFEELASGEKVFLDTTPIGNYFEERFPYITEACQKRGFNPVNSCLPVTPAAHFIMGGICTDVNGRTNINRLFACGEVACTGVHGANRLASNSLLEGLVFGQRVADQLINYRHTTMLNSLTQSDSKLKEILGTEYTVVNSQLDTIRYNKTAAFDNTIRQNLKTVMWQKVGLVRTEKQLKEALKIITKLEKQLHPNDWETKNMIITAKLITNAAVNRKESIGSHFRRDFPYQSTDKLYHQVSL